ncbi:piggyBac transposable element-derived protein 3-like [Hydra vulgaris]|uniref:piggyBac transposable element-derived protein 3-like n=1 Tax=Hydra vulgaris TaxID=6087 RepID=UPI001F5EEA8C|nr:piggyBac transposable element-derived protein 3-like [Hydra vulgaris]
MVIRKKFLEEMKVNRNNVKKKFSEKMSQKRYYSAAEVANIILEDIPIKNYSNLELSDSENEDFVLVDRIQAEQDDRELSFDSNSNNEINNIALLDNSGPVNVHFDECENPVDYFLKYIDDEIMESITYQSNLYIHQLQKKDPVVTKNSLYAFIGINMVMRYHKLPSWRNYCSNETNLTVPFVSDIIPQNRFIQILSNIHLNNNIAIPADNTDKLYKLRPLIDSLNNNFTKLYNISRYLSIDESMVLFKGRSSLKQYNPKKPIKRGYKLWSMADMDGYLFRFEIYQGKNNKCTDHTMPKYFGLGKNVVYQMTKSLQGKYLKV